MNNLDTQYTNLLQDILDNGVEKKDRTGTDTISVFGRQIRHKMSEGFPLLTTKKMPFKTIVTELIWFLSGDTNIKYLVDNGCHIWNGDAYKNYDKFCIDTKWMEPVKKELNGEVYDMGRKYDQEGFINRIKTDDEFAKEWGELGPIYGKQWRQWQGWIEYKNDDGSTGHGSLWYDQILRLIADLEKNPDSRRLMVNAWNVGEIDQMVLPPCHYGFQVYTRLSTREEKITNPGKYRAISLMWNQRSVDTFLGLPFNIASYGLLLEIIAKEVNMIPDELIGNLGDTHLYLNHIEQAKEQIGMKYTPEERLAILKEKMGDKLFSTAVKELVPFGGGLSEYYDSYKIPYNTREPFKLPKLILNPIFLANLEHKSFDEAINGQVNFELENYESHPKIKAPLSN